MSVEFPTWNSSDLTFTALNEQLLKISENLLARLNFGFIDYIKNTVEHLILAALLYITICVSLYYSIIKWKYLKFNREIKNAKRLLFIIAHPDDEVMFFGPTILQYIRKKDCTIYLMCLSTGKNYGMGTKRKEELYNSCKTLGIAEENIFVRNHTNLPDAMDVRWPVELISDMVLQMIEVYNITNLITFDRYGVSNHANHCSIYYAIANLILDHKLPKCCGVYVLESVNVIRKYWLILDIPLSFIMSRFRGMHSLEVRRVIFRAMKQHKSQLLWFRRLYMCFSRYTLINTLQQMNLVDIELDVELDD